MVAAEGRCAGSAAMVLPSSISRWGARVARVHDVPQNVSQGEQIHGRRAGHAAKQLQGHPGKAVLVRERNAETCAESLGQVVINEGHLQTCVCALEHHDVVGLDVVNAAARPGPAPQRPPVCH